MALFSFALAFNYNSARAMRQVLDSRKALEDMAREQAHGRARLHSAQHARRRVRTSVQRYAKCNRLWSRSGASTARKCSHDPCVTRWTSSRSPSIP